jgi:hypothetical protein
MISQAFSILGRNKSLAMYPIILDLMSFLIGIAVIGFRGEPKLTLKLALDVGLPSISSVLDRNIMVNGVHFSMNGPSVPMILVVLFFVFLCIGAFLQGGFIGLLYEAGRGQRVSLNLFLEYAKKFWFRFLALELLVVIFSMVLGGLLILVLKILGAILFIILFLVLRVLYIYWEFTVVVEDCGIGEAFTRSREHFGNRVPETMSVIISMIGMNAAFALVIHALWNPLVFIVTLLVYGYVATGMQMALMLTLNEICRPRSLG